MRWERQGARRGSAGMGGEAEEQAGEVAVEEGDGDEAEEEAGEVAGRLRWMMMRRMGMGMKGMSVNCNELVQRGL